MLLAKNKVVSAFFVICSVVYVMQALIAKPDPATLQKYHITTSKLHLVLLTIALPYIVIWFFALIGYLRLCVYSATIRGSKDGHAFRTITNGILGLSIWLPISTLLTSFFTHYYTAHPSATANLVRLDNYLNLALLFVSFLKVNKGSKELINLLKPRQLAASPSQTVTILYICFAALYVFLVLHDPSRSIAHGTTAAAYYQPDWLIMLTIALPRLIMWYLGIQAVQNIYVYRTKVKGSIYRHSLKRLATGIAGVVLSVITLRCMQSLSQWFNRLSLSAILIIIYLLLILIAVGYVWIARGAKSLQKLEEF